MHILGKNIVLRAIEQSDLDRFNEWGNDPELWRLLGGWHFPVSRASTQAWFDAMQKDQSNLRLAVCNEELGVIGLANLLELDWKNRHAFHGMMLGNPAARGKGIGLHAVMAIMRYAFDELGLNRLDGSMIEYNEASVRLYCGKCGWKEEGRQRGWYYRAGRYWDKIMVGVTREDYLDLARSTQYWGTSATEDGAGSAQR
jgi:RimJ/RimL family protein N-acetyltransferase